MANSQISLIAYNKSDYLTHESVSLEDLSVLDESDKIFWINSENEVNSPEMQAVFSKFNVPDYLRESISLSNIERADVRFYNDCYLFNLIMIWKAPDSHEIETEQLVLLLGNNFVITVQEGKKGDVFGKVRERLSGGKARSRSRGVDFLCYDLFDAIVESYYKTLDGIGDEIESFEEMIFSLTDHKVVSTKLHGIRDSLLMVRKAIYPFRDMIFDFERIEDSPFKKETRMFLHDLYNRSMQELETIDINRELLASLQDLHLSNLNQKLNEIMKVLTIITTLFIPLSFITGFYGMNLQMPENQNPITYPIVIAVMVISAIGMLLVFKKKKWF